MKNLFSLAIILLTCFFNAFGQIPTGKEVCGDYPEVQDDFSNKSAWYHSYYALNAVCDPVQYKHLKVTTEMIYKILLTHCNYVAPTYDTSPVGNCKRVVLNGVITFTTNPEYNFSFLNDPIITRVEPAIRRVTNYTLPAHRLHAGKVIRQIIYKNGKIQIETIGTGNNLAWRYWKINSCQSCMKSFWTSIDSRFIADVQRILAARDSASTIPPPVTESLSDTKELDFIINEAHEPYRYSLIYVTPAKGIALVGRYRPGIKVMLLNHATGKALSCTTTSVKTYPELHGSTIATNLDRTPVVNNEDAALKSMIAIIGNEGTYETINRTLINDIDKINQIDRAIKAGGLFSQALGKYNEGNLADSYAKLFQSRLPNVYQLNIPGLNVQVAAYTAPEQYTMGPRFLIINSKVVLLSGQCSWADFGVYKFKENYFIQSSSGMCESGYIVVEVFEIRNGYITQEFSNAGYSR